MERKAEPGMVEAEMDREGDEGAPLPSQLLKTFRLHAVGDRLRGEKAMLRHVLIPLGELDAAAKMVSSFGDSGLIVG
jgi:hypothetical protein